MARDIQRYAIRERGYPFRPSRTAGQTAKAEFTPTWCYITRTSPSVQRGAPKGNCGYARRVILFPNRKSIQALTDVSAALNQSKEDIREELENETFALLARLGFHGVTSESLQKLNPPDEYETELKVMAEVRGYFQVTYKASALTVSLFDRRSQLLHILQQRIIDNIPNFIDNEFVKEIAVELQGFLISKFKLGAPTANDRCAHYLSEDPALIARRNELLGTKKRLTDVKQQLEAFGVSTK